MIGRLWETVSGWPLGRVTPFLGAVAVAFILGLTLAFFSPSEEEQARQERERREKAIEALEGMVHRMERASHNLQLWAQHLDRETKRWKPVIEGIESSDAKGRVR